MGKTLTEIENLSNREIEEWMIFYSIDPFGEVRADLRSAMQTAHLISPHLKKGKSVKLSDFMLDFEPKKQMTNEQIKTVLSGLTAGVLKNGNS